MKSIRITAHGADILPIDALIEFQGNLKTITRANLDKLKRSILKHGFTAPIFVWKGVDYHILDGHQRLKALIELRQEGYDIPLLPVVYIDADSEEHAKEKLLYITSQYGDFTTEGFEAFVDGMDFNFDDLRLTDGDFVFTVPDTGETTGDDDAPEVQEEAVSVLGEIYELGPHRLMCGDSTDAEQVARLMGGEKADMVFTDPPYGMSAVSKSGVLSKRYGLDIMNDDTTDVAEKAFKLCQDLGVEKQVWWGANYYAQILPPSSCWLVWDKNNGGSDQMDCELAWSNLKGVTRQFTKASEKTNRVHPTQKPVDLITWCIGKWGADLMLDLFGGSGSTLIAAAKTDRKCRMMELDPKYCDVIRRRWTKWATDNGHEIGSGGLESNEV